MITRALGLLACLAWINTSWALETVTLKAGYNLRFAAKGRVDTTNRRQQTVVLMEKVGSWSKVCLGSRSETCDGGKVRWVYNQGLGPARQSAEFTPKTRARDKEPNDATAARTDATCEGDCKKGKSGLDRKLKPLLDAVDTKSVPGFKLGRKFSSACGTFINKNGLGEWGKLMVAAAHRVAPDCFYGSRNLFGSLCPNYKELSQPQKEAVNGIAFAAMAQVESTCNPEAQTVGTNDTADGMFQLEYSSEQRQDADRDERWCRANEKIDTQDPIFQSECTVSIVKDRVCSVKAFFFGPSTYWKKLKKENGAISQLIAETTRQAGLCKD